MLTKNNSVKLIDFSISRIEKENSESDTDFLGTRGYAPPEQFGFGQTDARSDIYSLGVTIQKILGKNYNGYLKKILSKCTELDPAKRYQSVLEISADIDKKFWQFKLKKFAVGLTVTCGIIFVVFSIPKNFFETEIEVEEKISEPVEEKKIEVNEPEKKSEPPKKIQSQKFEFPEIKIPETISETNSETPQNNFELPQISQQQKKTFRSKTEKNLYNFFERKNFFS